MWKGVDVSDNQGTIDWARAKAAGVEFAILRSVRRSGNADYQFAANLQGCLANNIPYSVYKYTYAVTPEAAQKEAEQVADLLTQNGVRCMVWWDVEDDETLRPLGSVQLTACIQTARHVIENAGLLFGIYSGMYIRQEKWFDLSLFADCDMWAARYYRGKRAMSFTENPNQDYKPDMGRTIQGWQYTSCGVVDGISATVDLDISYINPTGWTFEVPPKYYAFPGVAKIFRDNGVPDSYADRKRIAAANGITDYSGTATQNSLLATLWVQGQLKKY